MATITPVRDNFVRIGDIVTFKFLKQGAFLSAEGILVEDVFVSNSVKFFEEHQFQIYIQRQYSATNELESFLEKCPEDTNDIQDPATRNHLEALLKGKQNETTLNKTVMRNKTGNILLFGDSIQLLHVKSGKFVTVSSGDLARDERENMKVVLSSDGSMNSWIKIIPRYKINREGEQITNNVEVQLKFVEKANEFLHCADRPPPRSKRPEVNSSLESPTPWKISIFQRAEDLKDKSLLLNGQMVYIRDPESQCALAPIARPLVISRHKSRAQSRMNTSPSGEMPHFESAWSSNRMRMISGDSGNDFSEDGVARDNSQDLNDEESETESVSSIDEFIGDNGDVIFRPFQEGVEDSDAIWVMESKGITRGGVMKHKTDKVHFRHLNSGKYLSLRVKDEFAPDSLVTCLDPNPSERGTMFLVNQLHSNEENLINARAVQLKHSYFGVYFERGDYHDGQRVFSCLPTRIKAKSVSIILSRYEQAERKSFQAGTGRADAQGNDEVLDVYFGAAVMHHLQRFFRGAHIPHYAVTDINTLWPKIESSDRPLFAIILTRASLFVRGFPVSSFNQLTDLTKAKPDKSVIAQRQKLLRDQGLLEAMVNMLHFLRPVANWISNEAKQSTSRVQKGMFLEVCKDVLSQCLNMLFDLVKGNLPNQLYIADHLLVILAHVSTDKMAANVARELLSSNRELQETKIGQKEITIFANEMKKVPMNSMYLQLLQTCCSCMGQGLPKNQDIVHSVVFESNAKDVLIEVRVGQEGPKVNCLAEWGQGTPAFDLYAGPHLGKNYVRGETLVSEGPVQIYLTWSSKHGRLSPGRLYGKDVVSLWDLFRTYVAQVTSSKRDGPRRDSGAMQAADGKRAVCDFFIAQLQVSAEMCLGRNYHVINMMEKVFPYDSLLTIIKAPSGSVSNDVLKRSAAYLLQTLYIDRDPQSAVQLPRLTRTLTDVSRSRGVELVRVEGNHFYQFALVQVVISRHLQDIRGKAFASHSHNLLKILQKLVEFNFYGEIDKLKEVTEQLVACLRRDNSDLDDSLEQTAMFSNMMKHFNSGSSRKFERGMSSRRNLMGTSSRLSTGVKSDGDNSGEGAAAASVKFGRPGTGASVVSELFPEGDHTYTHGDLVVSAVPAWDASLLETLESDGAQFTLAAFAVGALLVSIYLEIIPVRELIPMLFDYAVFLVFLVETVLHLALHLRVRRTILPFFKNPFNSLDVLGVILYLVLRVGVAIRLAQYAKFARLFKAAQLLTLYFMKQVLKIDTTGDAEGKNASDLSTWVEPERYSQTPDATIGTLVKIVQVLCAIQRNIEDQNLSLLLKGYLQWASDPQSTPKSAFDVVGNVVKSSELSVSSVTNDDVYIDLLMYSHPVLVQVTLELLMIHHSSHQILIDNAHKMQLIATEAGEDQYTRMEKLVSILKRDADTHEIWGKLDSGDFRRINTDMHKYLAELTENCRKLREVLKFDETHEPVVATQNILRNLGCFDLCMKVVQLISSIDKDNPFAECHVNTRNLALAANRLLFWFVLDNPANQSLAYAQLGYFIKTIDAKIESDKVISAIFRNNISLMESVPKKHISDFVDMICNVGRFPQYLALMSSIICVGDKNVMENQYEVIKLMSSPENVKKVVQYFVPVSHPAYAKKVSFMAPYLNVKDVTIDALPSDLAYHLELMGLLSSCTVGRASMTTIEAKVQSMFSFVDVIDAMLDPNSILLAKIRLGLFLYNAMLDVETPVPAIKDADCVWKLLMSMQDVLAFAKDDLRSIEKNGWESAGSNRQKIEYMLVCVLIIGSYFGDYYDYTIFRMEVGQTAIGVERITIKENTANDIIRSLFLKISSIYDTMSPLLAEEHHKALYTALVALNKSAREKIVAEVEDKHTAFLRAAEDFSVKSEHAAIKPYDAFRRAFASNPAVTELAEAQVQEFIKKLENMPWRNAESTASVRFEPLVEKLVAHIRGSIQEVVNGDESQKFLEPSTTKTSIWVLRIFRTMVENKWGMTIYERDEDGGEEQDDAVVDLMKVYNESGVTNMCLDLIAKGIDLSLQSEALKLLVAMLFKEGGALDIQKTIYAHLSKAGSEMFFKTVRGILNNLMSWHKWNGVIMLEEGEEPQLPDEIILVRALQLMCEGHYQPNQDIFREQPNNIVSINLLEEMVSYLQALDNFKCRTSTTAEVAVSALILEVIQGPCEGNQDFFALNTELIETLNRKLRQHPVADCDETQELELKKGAIDIFQALLEGQARKTAVYERMLSVIHIDVILVLCRGEDDDDEKSGGAKGDDEEAEDAEKEEESEESIALRTESLVLMQMLTDFRPSLKTELGITDMGNMVGDSVACIEVVWRGELQRRFFHVPDICRLLAKSTRDNFIANVNRDSAENKLYGLLEATKEFYREVLHQQMLTEYKLDKIFSRTNQDRATWAVFYIVLAINLLFVLFYHTVDIPCANLNDDAAVVYTPNARDDDEGLPPDDDTIRCTEVNLSYPEVVMAVDVLSYVLIFLASFVLLQYLVVRVPVNFQAYIEQEMNLVNAAFWTAMDPYTLYFTAFMALAIIGLRYHIALTILLLDFVTKSPTSQSVLAAVYIPRKQIAMTLVLGFIVNYIFSMFLFFFFNNDHTFSDDVVLLTLGNVFRFLVLKGLPSGSYGDYATMTVDMSRIAIDLGYFVSILLILNILKGITIDTFVGLRNDLEERIADTNEICFICGIEKNTFNRTLDRDAFRQHIKQDQNLWSYVYFIIYIWEQDKDDDDGLESFVRRCIDNNDLVWFPMRKAVRLAEHQEKGDIHSMKFRFRKDLEIAESIINIKMAAFKDQLSRTIGRVEKSLEYEAEEGKRHGRASRATTASVLTRRSAAAARTHPSSPPGGAGLPPAKGGSSALTGGRKPSRSVSTDFDQFHVGSSPHVTPTAAMVAQAAAAASNRLSLMSSSESAKIGGKNGVLFTSALDADKLSQVHVKVISIIGLNIQQPQVELISVRIISEMETSVVYPEPTMERVKAFKTMLQNIATEKDRGKQQKEKFRTSFVSVKALFKEQENERGNVPEPTLLRFNVLENPKHLVHQGRLPTVDLSKYNVKVQILYGARGETPKLLGAVHIPFVELLHKAHTGEPLEVPFTQRQVDRSLITTSSSQDVRAPPSPAGPQGAGMMERNNFCFITLSAIASNDLLQEWAILTNSNH